MRHLFEPINNSASPSTDNRSFLLDFLYPAGTKEMLERWSTSTLRKWTGQKRSCKSRSYNRQFVSNAQLRQDTENYSYPDTPSDPSTFAPIPQSEKARELRGIFSSNAAALSELQWDRSWKLFVSIAEEEKPWMDMIKFLSTSTRSMDAQRVVQIAQSIPQHLDASEVYFYTIVAQISLHRVQDAIKTHESVLKSGSVTKRFEGTDMLIAHLLGYNDGLSACEVWDAKLKYHELINDPDPIAEWERQLRNKIKFMPGVGEMIVSAVVSFDQNQSLGVGGDPSTRHFARFLSRIFYGEKDVFRGNLSFKLLNILRKNKLDAFHFYRQSCLAICQNNELGLGYKTYITWQHYKVFRKYGKYEPDGILLRHLIRIGVAGDSEKLIDTTIKDFKTYLGQVPPAVATKASIWYARHGDLDKVDSLLADYLQDNPTPNLPALYPMLHVRAVRAEPSAVQQKLTWMKEQYDYDPDKVCWGILLKAYQRADDLDRILETFSSMLEAGHIPDLYTIIPVLSTLADRGDVETIRSLLAMKSSWNLEDSQSINDIMVLALINEGNLGEATNLARRLSTTAPDSLKLAMTRMWNQILTANAIGKDLDAMKQASVEMRTAGIKFDAMTYAALMRGYTANRQTEFAYGVFERFKHLMSSEVTAFHYAILINGYAQESKLEEAAKMHAEMLGTGIKPTLSSKLAFLNVQISAARDKSKRAGDSAVVGMETAEDTFDEILDGFDAQAFADTGPQFRSRKGPLTEVYPDTFYEALTTVYNTKTSQEVIKRLLARHETRVAQLAESPDPRLSTTIPTAMMNIYFRQGNTSEVESYFSIARDSALRLASLASTLDSNDNQDGKPLPEVRRTLLCRPFDIYQRALAPAGRWEDIHAAMNDLNLHGFDVDSTNFNWYVQLRATHGHYLAAFQMCEKYLIHSFEGWKVPRKVRTTRNAPQPNDLNAQFMFGGETSPSSDVRVVHLKTFVRLRHSLEKLQKESETDRVAMETLDLVDRLAPRTLHAVETMPLSEHPMFTHILGHSVDLATVQKGNKKKAVEHDTGQPIFSDEDDPSASGSSADRPRRQVRRLGEAHRAELQHGKARRAMAYKRMRREPKFFRRVEGKRLPHQHVPPTE